LVDRVGQALAAPAQILSDDPALAQAALAALLSDDAEVVRLRNQIGADLASRVNAALGPDASEQVVDALLLSFSGAMLQAGMGYFDYSGVVRRMQDLANLLST
jgi:hypothetical protein